MSSGAGARGSLLNNLAWIIFRCPGAVILWIRYHFPGKGQVYVSARQRGVPIIEVMYSLVFWTVAGFLVFGAIANVNRDQAKPVVATRSEQPATARIDAPAPGRIETPREFAQVGQRISQQSTQAPASVGIQSLQASPSKLTPQMAGQLVQLINDQIYQCWNVPEQVQSLPNPPVARVELLLNADGSLRSQPRVLNESAGPVFRAVADSALRAIRRCVPLRIPAQYAAYYADWKTVVINFNPIN